MELQEVAGKKVFVLDLPWPPPPLITPDAEGDKESELYARALVDALNRGIITEAGKYAIEVKSNILDRVSVRFYAFPYRYEIYRVEE